MTVTVVKRDGSQDHLSDDAVNELRTKLRGQLVVSDDPEARTEPREVWNAMHVDRPAITARCAGVRELEGTDCHVWTTSGQPEFPIGVHNARSIR